MLCKLVGGEFRKSILAPTPWYQNLVMPQFSYMPDQILGKNEKNPFLLLVYYIYCIYIYIYIYIYILIRFWQLRPLPQSHTRTQKNTRFVDLAFGLRSKMHNTGYYKYFTLLIQSTVTKLFYSLAYL